MLTVNWTTCYGDSNNMAYYIFIKQYLILLLCSNIKILKKWKSKKITRLNFKLGAKNCYRN